MLNILWIYKWNHRQKLTKKYLGVFFIFTTMAIFCTKPVWESDYARYFIDGVHSAKKIPVYKTIPSKSQYRSDFKQAWKESQYNNYGSIYPGLSVLFFKFVVLLSIYDYSKFIYIFKLFALIIGLSIAFLISKYKHDRYDYKTIILSMFHPLLILEWYVNLHFDFLFALCIVLFVYANKQFLKIAALTLGFHVKYLIFLFLPVSGIEYKKIKTYIFFVVCLLITGLIYHSKSDFLAMINNTYVFGLDWEMNAGSFRITRMFLSYMRIKGNIIKMSIFVQLCLILSFCIFHYMTDKLSKRSFWLVVFIFIITSPVVNPWYISWLIPLILISSDESNYKHYITLPIYISYTFYFLSFYQNLFYIEHLLYYVFLFLIMRARLREIKAKN